MDRNYDQGCLGKLPLVLIVLHISPFQYLNYFISAQLVENIAEDTHILKTEPKKVISSIKYSGDEEPTLWRYGVGLYEVKWIKAS